MRVDLPAALRLRLPAALRLRLPAGLYRPAGAAFAVSAVLAVGWLLAPSMGTDLAAQVARADFVREAGPAPVDLRWYGGIVQYGYSLLTPVAMAVVGVTVAGAVAAVVTATGIGVLLGRSGAARPVLGAVLAAVTTVGNLASGRITFAVGLAFAVLTFVTLTATRPARGVRLAAAVATAALATWSSPLAGLFTGLVGGAWLLARLRTGPAVVPAEVAAGPVGEPAGPAEAPDRRLSVRGPATRLRAAAPGEVVVAIVAPVLAVVPSVLVGTGGTQPFEAASMRVQAALAVAVTLVVPARFRLVRTAAGLAALLIVAGYYVPGPVGSNSYRLSMLYAVPVAAAFAPLARGWLVGLLAALVWWQPPVIVGDVTQAGSPESRASFYRPLVAELTARRPAGRVEVVPMRDHWESVHVARAVPLARGWERQTDAARNPLFYRASLSEVEYAQWLRRNAVSHVAVAPDSRPESWGRAEAELVARRPGFLREVWRDRTWLLFEVVDPQPLVSAPGTLTGTRADRVEFTVAGPVDVTVRVRWSRWLTVDGPAGACLRPGPDGWTLVHAPDPGRYTLGSAIGGGARC